MLDICVLVELLCFNHTVNRNFKNIGYFYVCIILRLKTKITIIQHAKIEFAVSDNNHRIAILKRYTI